MAKGNDVNEKVEDKKAAKKEKKNKKMSKREASKNMMEYTYRDLGQEFIMRRKMWRAIVFAIMVTIALTVFIALFISEKNKVQETYRLQYTESIKNMVYDIESYENADGDFDLRYNMLLTDAAVANSFVFLIDDYVDRQRSINELYTCLLKYPNQMKPKLSELKEILTGIANSEDEDGNYQKMDELVESIDKLGN